MDIKGLVAYLEELRENNNKEWFEANRPRYETLRTGFKELVADVISQTSKFDPTIGELDPAQSLFRINRDIRFSKDKSPYKVAFSAMLAPGTKGHPLGGYYMMIHADDDLIIGAGVHEPETDELAKLRKNLAEHGDKLYKIIKNPDFTERFNEINGEKLKNVPKDYPAYHPYADFLKYKSMTIGETVQASVLTSDAVTEHIVSGYKLAYPFVALLRKFVT
jgi:uncharacterized protein (TIGR02453 family)